MKRQMSWLLQTGRRMRQMVSLCRARAQSPGLSSCSVISIKEKKRLFLLIRRVKAFGRGLHSMAKTGAGVTRAPIIFNQAPLSSWHRHFATERKILVFYEKNEKKGKPSYVMLLGSIKTEFEWVTTVDALHAWSKKMTEITEKKPTQVEERNSKRKVFHHSKLFARCIDGYNAETFLIPTPICQRSNGSLVNKLLVWNEPREPRLVIASPSNEWWTD